MEIEDMAIDYMELNEQEISFDEVVENSMVSESKFESQYPLHGSYVCLLKFKPGDNKFYISHPAKTDDSIPIIGSTVDLTSAHDGQEVLVVFDGGDLSKPIITGVMRKEIGAVSANYQTRPEKKDKQDFLQFEADKEIILKCGKSSITLTKAGKVLIRGTYLLSRSSGANRIKGGSVHLN